MWSGVGLWRLHCKNGVIGCVMMRIACKTEKAVLKVFQSRKKIALLQI